MQKTQKKQWLITFLAVTVAAMLLLCGLAYLLDPFSMYHNVSGTGKVLNPRFVNAGLIRNYSYDSVVIGSSMVQNFDTSYFRETYHTNTLKLTLGGLGPDETEELYQLVQQQNGVETIFINIDLHLFAQEKQKTSRFPEHLYNDTVLDDIQYLLGYETWFRYIPLNLALNAMQQFTPLSEKIQGKMSVDRFGEWWPDFTFSKEKVMRNYAEELYATSKLDTTNLEQRMQKRIDQFMRALLESLKPGQQLVFAFPPYSALFWYTTMQQGAMETCLDMKDYFIAQCEQDSRVRMVDLQDIPEIANLDNYKDSTHFSPQVQTQYADALFHTNYDTSVEDAPARRKHLEALVNSFITHNTSWL